MNWIMEHLLELIFAAVSAGFGLAYKALAGRVKKMRLENEALRDGMQALLRDGIIRQYNRYNDAGEIPIYALENVERMYEAYHALGGNGTITGILEKLRELPTCGGHGGKTNER